jgi:valyl-tRNA synthetase
VISAWPEPCAEWDDAAAEAEIGVLQEMLGAVRNIRSEYGVAPGREVEVRLRAADDALRRALAA